METTSYLSKTTLDKPIEYAHSIITTHCDQIPEWDQKDLIRDNLEGVMIAVAEGIPSLWEGGAIYFLQKLENVTKATIDHIRNNLKSTIDTQLIARSILAAVNKKVSLIDEPHIPTILKWYKSSPLTLSQRIKQNAIEVVAAKPELIDSTEHLKLLKLNSKEDFQRDKLSLDHYIPLHSTLRKISRWESEIYAIKMKGKEDKDTAYWTIEYDVATKSLVNIRWRKNVFINAKSTYFKEIIQLLQKLIEVKGVQHIDDMTTLERTLKDNIAITTTGWKAISALTPEDKVIVSGKYAMSQHLFSSPELLQTLCSIPNVQLDFTNLPQSQKDIITKVAWVLVDNTEWWQGHEISFPKLREVWGIRIGSHNIIAKFPQLTTATWDILADGVLSWYSPNLESAGKILARAAMDVNLQGLKDTSKKIWISETCKHNIPEILNDKIVKKPY